MSLITCKNRRGGTLSFLLAVLFAVATSATLPARADEIVDLGGETISADKTAFSTYKDKIIQNGTINLSNSPSDSTAGKYTIGSGATVNYAAGPGFNGNWDLNIVDGGVMRQTLTSNGRTLLPFHYGNCKFTLDNGTFITDDGSTSTGAVALNFAMFWNNNSAAKGVDASVAVVIRNGSTLSIPNGKLRISGGRENESQAKNPAKTAKVDFAVTNSTITVKDQIYIGSNISSSKWVTDAGNSYVHVVFGPGADITCNNIYAYKSIVSDSEVLFDGATLRKGGSDANFIGQNTGLSGDIYTIGEGGLTIDIPSDQSFTAGSNMSVLKGAGGLTKIGAGSITVNSIVSSSSAKAMTFTGPLVVSNGTYSSSLTYAAMKFAVDGADSTLALSGTLTAAAPDMAATDGGTLNLRTGSVVSRTVGAMTLGEGATLAITGGGPGVDSFSAASLALTATAAKPVKIEFDDAGSIPSGTYPLITLTGGGEFAAGDNAKFALDENAPDGAALSVSGASLVLTVPATNPATWTGGANDGKFSSVNNWLGKAVPGADADVIIDIASETTLDCDVALNINSITFPATSAKVTIGGTGSITCAATIKNYAEARHAIGVPVEFYASEAYAPIDVTGEVEFSGSVTGTVPVNHTTFYGKYTLTATSWTLSSAITLAANATVTATGMELKLSGTNVLNAEAGSSMTVKYIKPTYADTIGSFAGTLTATNQLFPEGANPNLSFDSGFTGVLKTKEIKYHTAGYSRRFSLALDPSAEVVLGGVGVNVMQGTIGIAGCSLRSSADWSFTSCKNGYNKKSTIDIGSAGITVDTSDYYDSSAAGHTVYVKTENSNYSDDILSGTGGVIVNGNGQFVFQKSALFTGTLAVNDSVALNVNAGVAPGKGNVTFRDTATFDLVQSGSGTVPVTGTLTMAGGTTLRIPTLAGGVLPLSVNALAFDGVTAENKVALNIEGGELVPGFNAIIQSKTALPANAWDNFAVTLGATVPSGMETLYIAQGNTLYIVLKGCNDVIWTGDDVDAKFSNPGNWMGGGIPENGSCVHIAAAGETVLENDIEGFSPSSITFPAGSAAITINGECAIKVTAITNLSSSSHTINVPVYFNDAIAVVQNARGYKTRSESHIVFSGGAYANEGETIASWDDGYSWAVFGNYVYSNNSDSPYTVKDYKRVESDDIRFVVGDNSTLFIPYAGDMRELEICSGSVVNVGEMRLTGSNDRVTHKNLGEIVVTNLCITGSGDRFLTYDQSGNVSSVFKFISVTNNLDTNWFYLSDGNKATRHTVYVGELGLNFSQSATGAYCIGRNVDGNVETIRPWYSDFVIADHGNNNARIVFNRDVIFCTDDENGVGRKITVDAVTRGNSAPTITVSGSGILQINKMAQQDKTQPPVSVIDTATLAYKPGASLGSGLTTINAGAMLQVAESGEAALDGDLNLADGAKLKFTFSKRNIAPVLDVAEKTVTLGENKALTVAIDGVKRPCAGRHVLTSGGKFAEAVVSLDGNHPKWVLGVGVNDDGNIYADIKPMGTRIIVR